MTTSYEDYYSEFTSTHESANDAYEIASSKSVSSNLKSNISSMLDVISGTKLEQPEDEVAVNFDAGIVALEEKLNKLNEFSTSYENVETAYVELKDECDALKKGDESLKSICSNPPVEKSSKYKIPNTDPAEYDYSAYLRDKNIWEEKVKSLKEECISLADNIRKYIEYLGEVDGCLPSDGAIETVSSKPSPISGEMDLSETVEYDDTPIENNGPYVLEGEELEQFLLDNNIPNADYVKVVKSVETINGVEFPIYRVYDTDCDDATNEKFDSYIEECLQNEAKIDEAVLARISNGGTALVFEETYRCDGGSLSAGRFNCAAYCNSRNRNVVQFFHDDSSGYYARSIVHETGHAFDFTLRFEASQEQCCGISHITQEMIDSGQISKEQADLLFDKDENGNYITWDRIINDEVNYFDSSHSANSPCCIGNFNSEEDARAFFDSKCVGGNIEDIVYDSNTGKYTLKVSYENPGDSRGVTVGGGSSQYNIHDYVGARHEYFADSFQAYYLGDDNDTSDGGISRFEYLCPETYSSMERLIDYENSKYDGGDQ